MTLVSAIKWVWNPDIGINIGSFTLHYYSLTWLIAFALGWYITKFIYRREGIALEKLDSLFVYTMVATMLGARLGHVFFYDWEYYQHHLLEIILPFKFIPEFEFTGFSGLASHGAAIGIIIGMYFYKKKVLDAPILWILDRVVIPVASGGVLIRLGNFINSEIVGKPTDGSIAVKFVRNSGDLRPFQAQQIVGTDNLNEAYTAIAELPQYQKVLDSIPWRHPTQLYEAFCYVLIFALLMFMYWKTNARKKIGLLFGTFLVSLWSVRFFIEFFKEAQVEERATWLLNTGQWLSIPFIVFGLYLMFKKKKDFEFVEAK